MFNKKAMEMVSTLRTEKKCLLVNKAESCDLYLYDVIGEAFGGISAMNVIDQLKNAKGKTLNVRILSEGGDVFTAKAIYNAIKQFNGKKVCYVDGLAASAATFVMCAGDKVMAAPGSTFMTHGVWTATMGNAEDMRKMADQLELETNNIAQIYAAKTGKTVEEMAAWMANEEWFGNEQAIDMKFIDGEYQTMAAKTDAAEKFLAPQISPFEMLNMRMRAKK